MLGNFTPNLLERLIFELKPMTCHFWWKVTSICICVLKIE